jgi:hypothetical protein
MSAAWRPNVKKRKSREVYENKGREELLERGERGVEEEGVRNRRGSQRRKRVLPTIHGEE